MGDASFDEGHPLLLATRSFIMFIRDSMGEGLASFRRQSLWANSLYL